MSRLFIIDNRTKLQYLIDTGSDISISTSDNESKQNCDYLIFAANGSKSTFLRYKRINCVYHLEVPRKLH